LLASSDGLVGVLSPVVGPAADLLAFGKVELFHNGLVRSRAVGPDGLGTAEALHQLLHKLQGRSYVAALGDKEL
jgi:hypothetical protein